MPEIYNPILGRHQTVTEADAQYLSKPLGGDQAGTRMLRNPIDGKHYPVSEEEFQFLSKPGRTLADTYEPPAQPVPDEGVGLADYGKAIMAGGAQVGQGFGWLAKQVGFDQIGQNIEELGRDAVDYWTDSLSDAAKDALSREFIHKADDGSYEWGDATLNTVGLMGAQSLLGTAAGAGAGAGITKVLQLFANPLGRSVLVAAARSGSVQATRKLGLIEGVLTRGVKTALGATKRLRALDTVVGALGFGLGEGLLSGTQTGASVESAIKLLPPETLLNNPRYQQIYNSTDEHMSELERHQYATDVIAKEAGSTAGWQSGLLTSLLGAPMGAYFGRILGQSGRLASTRLASTLVGAGGEAAQEALQSAGESAIGTQARVKVGEQDLDVLEAALNDALGGALAGGLLGGAVGSVDFQPETAKAPRGTKPAATPPDTATPLKNAAMRAAQAGAPREQVVELVKANDKPLIDRIAGLRKLEAAAAAAPEPEPTAPTYGETLAETFPVVGGGTIPRAVAETAYAAYVKDNPGIEREQPLAAMAQRGGFHPGELDQYAPGWREQATLPKQRTQETPLDVKTPIDEAAHRAATSPLNPTPPPTPEQIEAENYEAGRIKGADIGLRSLDFAIEYPRGVERGGKIMRNHYGRIPGVVGGDGMSFDFFMGNDDQSETVYLYHNLDKAGRFSQHKALVNMDRAEAEETLKGFYDLKDIKDLRGGIVELSKPQFEQWVASGNTAAPHPDFKLAATRRVEGQPTRAITPAGEAINAKYALVELGDLTSSHTLTGRANARFPQELQPRDRSRAGLRQWIVETAARFEPALAVQGASAGEGAPIVGPDGVIESGNGRAMLVSKLYLDKSDVYRNYLKANAEQFGFTPEQVDSMARPILVRERTDAMDMAARARFATEANRPNLSTFSATEQANADARVLTNDEIGTFNPGGDGNVLADSNRTFVRSFIGKLPATERAGLLTADGGPTRQLANRMQAAIFARAYQDDRLLALMAEEANPDVRNVVSALTAAAPAFARARAAGVLSQADVVTPLVGAIEVVRAARAKGQPVGEYLDQRGLFGDVPEDVARMARFVDSNLRSARRMGEAFSAMASFLETESAKRASGSLFDEVPLDVDSAMAAANQRMQATYGGGAGQAALFSQAPKYAERQPGETDKQYAKRAIDPLPEPESVPYQPDKMFAHDPRAVLLPVESLVSTKSDAENAQGRATTPKRLLAAAAGVISPRGPISVRALPNGRYEVVDGNGTVAALKDLGWPAVPAIVENATDRRRAIAQTQAGWSVDEIYQRALPNQLALARAGTEIGAALGVTFSNPGIKARARLEEKLTKEGYEAPGEVVDVVRGAFLTDSAAESDAIVAALAERFGIHDKGIQVTNTGYVDRKVLVRFDDGQVGEVQITPRALDPVARGEGANLYKQARALLRGKTVPAMLRPRYDSLVEAQRALYVGAVAETPAWADVALAGAPPELSQALNLARQLFSSSGTPSASATTASTAFQGLPGAGDTNATTSPESLSPVTSGRSSSEPNSRTDETGRSTEPSVAHSEQVRQWLAPELKALEPIVRAHVVATPAELPDPNAPPDVEGAYTIDGEVWFVASNLPTEARARAVGRHEVFGHMAIERNGKFKARLDAVQRAIRAGNFKALAREVRARQGLLPAAIEAREVVALMAERGVKSPLLGSMRSALREVGRDLGLDMPLDEGELTALVAVAAGDLKRDAQILRDFRAAQGMPAVKALEKADPSEAEIIAALDAIYGPEDAPLDRGVLERSMHQRAYHGSPHEFSRFSLDRIGSGEGAQAYGWGLYFTSLKEVAEHYRKLGSTIAYKGTPLKQLDPENVKGLEWGGPEHRALAIFRDSPNLKMARYQITHKPNFGDPEADAAALRMMNDGTVTELPGGKVYEVEIPEDHTLADMDAYLENQPPKVRRALREVAKAAPTTTSNYGGGGSPERLLLMLDDPTLQATFERFLMVLSDAYANSKLPPGARGNGPDRAAALALRDAGVLGHKYKGHGSGVTNYVIYDDAAIETKAMYSRRGPDTEAFKAWFGDSKVVDKNGEPLVVYHGTVHDIEEFSRDRVDPQSDMGAGFYFTDSKVDVANNYAGRGQDLKLKVEQLADTIEQSEGTTHGTAVRRARAKLVANRGVTMPVYLKITNPVVIGGKDETRFTYEVTTNEEGGVEDETGTAIDLLNAAAAVAEYAGVDPDDVTPELYEAMAGGDLTASRALEILRNSDELRYAEDDEGRMIQSELIRQIFERAGYDGIIDHTPEQKWGRPSGRSKPMRGLKGTTHYIAFEPEQVKSAVGNRGTFDPQNPSILMSRAAALPGTAAADPGVQALLERIMAPRTADMSIRDRAREAWRRLTGIGFDSIRQGVIDSFDAVKQLEQGQFGKLLDAAESPYKAALATRNLPSVMAATMLRGVPEYRDGAFQLVDGRQGIIEIFQPLTEHPDGNLLPLWELYAAGKRAKKLKAQGREKLFSDADIAKALALGEQYPIFEQVAKDWERFNGQLLDLAVERGVLDPAAVAKWKDNFYVPFYRAMEEAAGGEGPKAKRGLEGHGGAAVKKRLKGGEGKLGDVFENMLMNTAYLIDESFKNTAMQKIAAMGEGVAMERIPLKWDAVQLPAGQLEKALDQMGASVMSQRAIRPGEETAVPDANVEGGRAPYWQHGLSNEEREEWLKLFRRVAPVGKDVVAVYEGGKPVYYRVTDDLLLRSIANMGYDNFSDVMGLFRGSKRLLTGAITLDPAFMMANWVRDTLSTWVTSEAGITPVVDAIKGVKAALEMNPDVLSLMAAGAGGGGVYDMQPAELRTFLMDKLGSESAANRFMGTIVSPKNWLKVWRKIGNAAENANRVAVYRAVRAAGGSVAEAAYQARDVLNFTMSGDYAAMRWLTATVPFMNARIQGLYRLWRAGKEHPLAFTMKGLSLTAASLALLLANQDDEEYEQLPEWDKDTYWHFFVGGEHYRLPKPFEVGAIFGTIPERMFRLGSGRDSASIAKQRVAAMLGETFAFNPVPQVAKPIIEQYANRSFFTGSPIVGMAEANLQPEAQYTPWTSESMKLMAEALPDFAPQWLRSPQRLEALLRGYLGATGLYALQAADTLAREASGAPPRPARKLYDVPVVKRFMQDPNPRVTKYADQLYDMLEESNAVFRTVNRYREEGRTDEAKALIEENRGKLAARARLNRIATRVRALNNQIQLTLYSQALTPEAKRARIDELQSRKNAMTAQVAPLAELF